jgi:hypothetical protein
MDLEPGRIGFMNTQRRENRWQRTSCTQRAGASRTPGDGSESPGWRLSGHASPAPIAQKSRAHAKVGTAPPATPARFDPSDEVGAGAPFRVGASPGARDRLATNSLQSDYRTTKLVQHVRLVEFVQFVPLLMVPSVPRDTRHKARSAPPSRAGVSAATRTLTALGSSISFIPFPSGLVRLHPTWPRFPAGKRRWTERYDGKGNLHLLYAA